MDRSRHSNRSPDIADQAVAGISWDTEPCNESFDF